MTTDEHKAYMQALRAAKGVLDKNKVSGKAIGIQIPRMERVTLEEQNIPKTCKIYQVGSLEVEKYRVFIEEDVSQKDDPHYANALAQQEMDKEKDAIEETYKNNPVQREKEAWRHAWEKETVDAEIERRHRENKENKTGEKEKGTEETLDSENNSSSDKGDESLFATPIVNNANIFKAKKLQLQILD